MKLTKLTIKDLITPDAKLTFLVGAGCSVDPPSNLPTGKTMMEALIRYTCAESEIDKLLGKEELEDGGKLEGLRFEQLVEIIRDRLDPELKIIDFYGLCDKPNIQHFFLAEMMKQGQFVLTTNFDFLIEYALQELGITEEKIKIVITKEDFEQSENPEALLANGIKTLYKIHGSTKNLITKENARDSLIATLQAFGANKEGENVFQLESFKQPAFVNLTKGRSLVVMGYSGSDDFDIVPTLKILKNVQDIIWINYIHEDGGKELIYEIDMEDINNYEKLTQSDQILADIKRMNYTKHVFRVDVNTSRMVGELSSVRINNESDIFSVDVNEWLLNNMKSPDKLTRLDISYIIYYDFDLYKDAMSVINKMLTIAEQDNEEWWIAFSINGMGLLYQKQGNYSDALKCYERALPIFEELGDLGWKGNCLNNIATIQFTQGNYPEALKRYEEVLQIDEQLGNLGGKAIHLNNIGTIYKAQGNYSKALKCYEEAFQIDEQLGNLSGKARALNHIAEIFSIQGNYSEALKRYEEALQIFEELGNLVGKATLLNNIGEVHRAQGNYPEALQQCEKALQIHEQLGNLSGIATGLNNIADIFRIQENYPEALIRYEESLQIFEELGDLVSKATVLNNIGAVHHVEGNYPEALRLYEEALLIDEQLGDLSGKANRLNNIGSINYSQGNYPEALKKYGEALQINTQLEDLAEKTKVLNNLAGIYYIQGNYPKALKYLEEAIKILNELGLSESLDAQNIKKGIELIKKSLDGQ
ncbi:MAG: tetratricopeptide repeat protein [Candidatus Hermodarchaeota archaeon]